MNNKKYKFLLNNLDKAENGLIIDEKEWDRHYIGDNIKRLIEKYDVSWNEGNPFVPDDDALADRVFEAGFELACETGVYCIDTKRQIKWSRAELEEILSQYPGEFVLGTGEDRVTVSSRKPEDPKKVVVYGGPFGIPVSEELFIPFHEAYAKETLIEILNLGTILSTHGRMIRAGSPWEAVAARQESQMALDILKKVGRPGMPVGCVEIATTEVGELAGTTYGGYRPTDIHKVNFVSEQKTAYHHLTKATHYLHTDAFSEAYCNPIYGGYVGGSVGVAIASVSGLILLQACYLGTLHNLGPTHIHLSASTHPGIIKAMAVAFQGVSRHTNLIISPFVRPVAGPGTKDILYECAALVIASVASGVSYIDVVQSATGNIEAQASPLEVRFGAQIAHAAQGLSRKEADKIVRDLVGKFAGIQKEKRIGKPFTEVYDLKTLRPTSEWQTMFEETCEEMRS
ncbi:MAG: monomethylamine:corrinoid methyltransferase, partial [Thermoplasmata archaeon]|nr:monomethylamine:corrinoid methyltransferase [Thermoplasmata archaeon]